MSADLFETKHRQLLQCYEDESGLYAESCTLLAIDLAELLIKEGKSPQIFVIRSANADSVGNRAMLKPKPYGGKVVWGAHVICVVEGVVHDPMLESPLAMEEYLPTVFDQPVELEDRTRVLIGW